MEYKFRLWLASFVIVLYSNFLIAEVAVAQSAAYKVLLNGLYDKNFPTVTPSQIINLENYQVLDTREKAEFDVSHLSGAKWVGYETFALDNVKDLDKNKPVLVYCTVGARSEEIGKKLLIAGFKHVYNLYGGIIHWSNERQPLFTDTIPTTKIHTYSRTWGIWLTSGEKVF